MFCFVLGVLGNKQIKKKLGKDIFIYPFKESNLKGASYNLTASKLAYIASNKKIAVNSNDEIIIPAHETVLIQTQEAIYTRKQICGTYHSKVSLVSEGFSHIGTTLDPGYMGPSLIAITNNTNEKKKIKCTDSIVTIMFYRVSGCDKEAKDNAVGREDLIPKEFKGFSEDLTTEQKKKIKDDITKLKESEWRKDYEVLIDIVRREYNIKKLGIKDLFIGGLYIILQIVILYLYVKNKIKLELYIEIFIAISLVIIPWINDLISRRKR